MRGRPLREPHGPRLLRRLPQRLHQHQRRHGVHGCVASFLRDFTPSSPSRNRLAPALTTCCHPQVLPVDGRIARAPACQRCELCAPLRPCVRASLHACFSESALIRFCLFWFSLSACPFLLYPTAGSEVLSVSLCWAVCAEIEGLLTTNNVFAAFAVVLVPLVIIYLCVRWRCVPISSASVRPSTGFDAVSSLSASLDTGRRLFREASARTQRSS